MAVATTTARPKVRAPRQAVVAKPPLEQVKTLHWVQPQAGYYLVMLDGDPARQHLVRKDRTCLCALGTACPAVEAVSAYLKAGGERAADVAEQTLMPAVCPECGGAVKFEPRLCSPARGAGWVCVTLAAEEEPTNNPLHIHGERHYWRAQWGRLRPYFQRHALVS